MRRYMRAHKSSQKTSYLFRPGTTQSWYLVGKTFVLMESLWLAAYRKRQAKWSFPKLSQGLNLWTLWHGAIICSFCWGITVGLEKNHKKMSCFRYDYGFVLGCFSMCAWEDTSEYFLQGFQMISMPFWCIFRWSMLPTFVGCRCQHFSWGLFLKDLSVGLWRKQGVC